MPQQSDPYDFIVNPAKPPKKPLLPPIGAGSSFKRKLILIIGGGIVLLVVLWVAASLLGGGGSSASLTKLVQQEQEIARVAAEGAEASRSDIKNAAVNTQLSLASQQQEWLRFLADRGAEMSDEQQAALQNAATDQQLETARGNNTFDKTFLDIMRTYLTDYSNTLQTTFTASKNESERALLQAHFDQTQLLLEQLPKS